MGPQPPLKKDVAAKQKVLGRNGGGDVVSRYDEIHSVGGGHVLKHHTQVGKALLEGDQVFFQ